MKIALQNAEGKLDKFKAFVMGQRREAHENKMLVFIENKGQEIQGKIVEEAKSELRRIENIRKVKEADERRRKQI